MKRSVFHAATAAAAALALSSLSTSSLAQEEGGAPQPAPPTPAPPQAAPTTTAPPVVITPPPPREVYVAEEKTPNVGLIGGGAVMLGLSYAGSVVVAAASDRPSDRNLYVPLAGPWMDLANRGHCVAPRCENETGNNVLLVVDGIFQGVGALQILGGFLFPSTRTVARTAGVHVTPTAGRSSVGISAYGAF